MFEHAKWITRPGYEGFGPHGLGPAPYFKKTFSVKASLVKATLSACGLGMAVYYANGQTIGDQVLITPLTKFDARSLYSTFDLTAYLQEGENTIGACLGNGWYNTEHAFWQYHMASWRDVPKMVAQLDLMYADESCEQIVTDLSWLSHDAPTLWNDPRGGEEYDARLELPDWCQPFGSTDGWKPVVLTKSPGGALLPMQHPPIRITRRLEGQRVTDTIWDFGQNFSGWVKITVEGEAGASVLLEYSELFENGEIDNTHISVFDNGKLKNADRYILKGEGQEIWAPMFQYHGFRWCKVTISGAARLVSIVGEVVHTDFSIIGDFSCSDDMLNRIHTAVRWSTLCNYHGIPTDCPHREQNGWTGDASLSAEQSLMNYDMKEAYRKWMMDFCDVQRPSGQIPAIVPTCSWGYNWGSGPAWDSAMMLIPYYVWQNTGDTSLIEQMWEPLNRYMDFIATMAVDDLCEFGLGDWCPPPGANICPTKLTDSAYYYVFATTMVICSGIMKDKEQLSLLRAVAQKRGLIVFACGMLCTAVTLGMVLLDLADWDMVIWFGILHCLGCCMLLWPIVKKLPAVALAGIGVLFAAVGNWLYGVTPVDFPYLIFLGICPPRFFSPDFFPLLPNFGYFLLGAVLGRTVYRKQTSLFPNCDPNTPLVVFLSACGRHSLAIYLLHQPLLSGLCLLLALIL